MKLLTSSTSIKIDQEDGHDSNIIEQGLFVDSILAYNGLYIIGDNTFWIQYLKSSISGKARHSVLHILPRKEDTFQR